MSADSEFSKVMKHYFSDLQRRQKAALASFAQYVVPELAKAGIRRIDVTYSGYGDSGAIDDITCYGDEDKELPLDAELRDHVCQLAYEIVPPGFENNDGGEGVIKIDLVNGKYHLHHGERVSSVEWSDSEGEF